MKSAPLILIVACVRTFGTTTPDCRALIDSGDIAYGEFNNRRAYAWYRRAHMQCPGSYEALMKTAHEYRCIADDRRGHGRSDQPWNGNDMDTYADLLSFLKT